MWGKTVVIKRKEFIYAIKGYCKRNGVSVKSVANAHGISDNFECNGKRTYERKHPGSDADYIELLEQTYKTICTAYLLTPSRYIVDDAEEPKKEAQAQVQEMPDKTSIAYLRMINERLMDVEKAQAEQIAVLRRLLEVWEKA